MAGLALVFLVNAALARMLVPEDFGSFVLLLSTMGFCATVARFGLDRSIIRLVAESLGVGDVARARQTLRMGWRLAAVTTIVTAVATMVVLSLLGDVLQKFSWPRTLVPVIGLGLVLLGFLHLAAESLRGFHELRFASLFDGRPNGPLVNLVFLSLFAGVAAVSGLSLPLVLGSYVAAVTLVLAAAMWCLWKTVRSVWAATPESQWPPGGSLFGYSHLLALCVPLWGGQLVGFVLANADVWIAGSAFRATSWHSLSRHDTLHRSWPFPCTWLISRSCHLFPNSMRRAGGRNFSA